MREGPFSEIERFGEGVRQSMSDIPGMVVVCCLEWVGRFGQKRLTRKDEGRSERWEGR